MTRRSYSGAAQRTRLTTQVGTSDTTLVIANPSGWPTGANGPFFVTLSRGTANEEKVLVSSRTAGVLAVAQRGADGTAPLSHPIDAAVEHVWTAVDADESNEHVNRTGAVHGTMSAVVGVDDAQTLRNKAISGLDNTLTDLPIGEVVGLAAEQAAQDAATALVQSNLNAESSARVAAISAEASARAAGDAALHSDIANVANDLSAEAAARQAADLLLLPKAGGAVTGDLSVAGTFTAAGPALVPAPTANGHAATKKYVDDALAALKSALAPVAPVNWAWGNQNYVWRSPSGNWTSAPGAPLTIPTKPGGVYLVRVNAMVYNPAVTAARMSIWVNGAIVVESSGSADSAARSAQSVASFVAVGETTAIDVRFSGVFDVIGNGWMSPSTTVTLLQQPIPA